MAACACMPQGSMPVRPSQRSAARAGKEIASNLCRCICCPGHRMPIGRLKGPLQPGRTCTKHLALMSHPATRWRPALLPWRFPCTTCWGPALLPWRFPRTTRRRPALLPRRSPCTTCWRPALLSWRSPRTAQLWERSRLASQHCWQQVRASILYIPAGHCPWLSTELAACNTAAEH